jgi:hypothetical protein
MAGKGRAIEPLPRARQGRSQLRVIQRLGKSAIPASSAATCPIAPERLQRAHGAGQSLRHRARSRPDGHRRFRRAQLPDASSVSVSTLGSG